jgi:hypothetical protein
MAVAHQHGEPADRLVHRLEGASRPGAASVSGDRYLGFGQVGDGGGLRATGALLFGPPSLALGAPGRRG